MVYSRADMLTGRDTTLMNSKIRTWLVALAGTVFALALLAHFMLDNSFVQYPNVPEPISGKLFPYQFKGSAVYVTEDQRSLLDWLVRIKIVSGLVFFGGLIADKVWPSKPSDRLRRS